MLIQFTVGNFRSFKDKASLSLEATHDDWREDDNLAQLPSQRLVKAASIYGPNAGGKSNFLKAMIFFREFIKESSKDTQKGEPIPVVPFRLHATTESAPSFFEAIFLHNGTRYRYGFEATPQAVRSEWLFKQADSIRETRLFTREGDQIEASDSFKEGKGLESRTRPNALFLSVVAQFNGQVAGEVLNWMNQFRSISGLEDEGYLEFTSKRLSDPEFGPLIRELVKQADIGIEDLARQDIARDKLPEVLPKTFPKDLREFLLRTATAGAYAVKTYHKRFDGEDKPTGMVEFDLKTDESAGTQKFVALTGPFLHTLREGSVLFVDELEARLHPLLTKALVALFNSSANRKHAQLIFATHDVGLLDSKRIRRDQVWFVEKNAMGASRLYCLDEFKGVRREAKFAQEYLLGQFGGVPRLGDFQEVLQLGRE
ncbi:MAG: ATP-binding protein [Limisphaerales bacterium]